MEGAIETDAIDLFSGNLDGSSDTSVIDLFSKSEGVLECRRVAVTWRVSGGPVCTVQLAPETRTLEVKTQIRNKVGVPVAEMHLFEGDLELPSTAVISPTTEALSLLRDSDSRNTDLSYFSATAKLGSSISGELTMVKKLASALNGFVGLYRWKRVGREDERVAVKKMPNHKVHQQGDAEINDWVAHGRHAHGGLLGSPENSLTEIGILTYLSRQHDLSPHLLKMRDVFADCDFTWLITDYAEGGELFAQVAARQGVAFAEDTIRLYMRQLLEAVAYLHAHFIGHRDVSLENIVLQDGNLKLMDFGMAVQTHSPSGVLLRYFRIAGKDMYRAPECHLPALCEVRVTVPKDVSPGDVVMVPAANGYLIEVLLPEQCVPGKVCNAEPLGYMVPPVDVFAIGVCLFVLTWLVPPWKRATLSDPYFNFVHSNGENGPEALLQRWAKNVDHIPAEALQMMAKMLRPDPSKRASLDECLANPWLAEQNEG